MAKNAKRPTSQPRSSGTHSPRAHNPPGGSGVAKGSSGHPPKSGSSNLWLILATLGIGFTLAVFVTGGEKPVNPSDLARGGTGTTTNSAPAPSQNSNKTASQTNRAKTPVKVTNVLSALPRDAETFGGDAAKASEFSQLLDKVAEGTMALPLMRNDVDTFKSKVGSGPGAAEVAVVAAQLALRMRDTTAANAAITQGMANPGQQQEVLEALKLQAELDALPPEGVPSPELISSLASMSEDVDTREVKALTLFTWARALDKAKQSSEALPVYRQLARDYSGHQEAAMALMAAGRILEEQKDTDGAVEMYRQAAEDYAGLSYTKNAAQYMRQIEVIGKPARDLSVSTWVNGDPGKITDQKDKVVLLLFFASWCPHCRDEMPEMVALHNKYKDQGLVLIGVTNEDDRQDEAKIRSYLQEASVPFPVALQNGRDGSKFYAVSGIPAAALVDKSGTVVWRNHPGQNVEEEIKKLLEG